MENEKVEKGWGDEKNASLFSSAAVVVVVVVKSATAPVASSDCGGRVSDRACPGTTDRLHRLLLGASFLGSIFLLAICADLLLLLLLLQWSVQPDLGLLRC